jgi:hypothetical protein
LPLFLVLFLVPSINTSNATNDSAVTTAGQIDANGVNTRFVQHQPLEHIPKLILWLAKVTR